MTSPPEAPCQACGEELTSGARFCPSCGTPTTPPSCASCGEELTPRARFCPSCGTPVGTGAPASAPQQASAPVAERRVVSVLFGDLVGFTAISESRDAEDVRELLSRYFAECRTIIGRYGGTVEKFIGDAVMAVWGVPVAHEDDAERAVRAGLELVSAIAGLGDDINVPGLAMRVGVVTGEVAVTLGATAEGMVAGDAVNTAARVQSVATPGEVWVDETTRSLTAASITFEDCGAHALKGKSEQQHLFAARAVVADVGGVGRVDGLEAPLAGRDRELRLLKELFHATEETRRPRLVVVDGDPGMGKSRLAREFEKYADGLSTTVRWHRGRCLSYGEGVAFWALAEAVRSRLGLVESTADEHLVELLDAGLAQYVPDPEEREWLRPRIAALVGVTSGSTYARDDLFAAWSAFLERVGGDGEHAVVLVIDDAQYADEGLLDFLDYLLTRARSGIFVLALARPELLSRRSDLGGRRASVIRLDPLDDAAMEHLIDGLVVGLPASARTALAVRAEGIPLYAVETVRALIDRDTVIPRGGRYVLAEDGPLDLDAIGAPASLQALVAARLDALSADERRIVADASVLGVSFTREGLADLADDSVELDAVLTSLQRKEIVAVQHDRFSAERGQYRFVQGVVRQVAYATQSKRDRKARHLAAARFLQSETDVSGELAVVIAQHLIDAVDASSPGDVDVADLTAEARDQLELAAAHAQSLGAVAEALRLLDAALARADTPALEARLRLLAARAAWNAGDFRAQGEHGLRAMEILDDLDDPIGAGQAACELAESRGLLTGQAAAIEIAEPRWQALEGTPGAEMTLSRLAAVLGGVYTALGDWDMALSYAQRRLLLAESTADAEELAATHIALGHGYLSIGAPQTARALTLSAAEIARDNDLADLAARALNNLASSAASRDLEEALDFGRQGIAAARRSGIPGFIEYTSVNYALALWNAGRFEEARVAMAEAMDVTVVPGMRYLLASLDAWTSDALGITPAEPEVDVGTDDVAVLAWRATMDLARARAAGTLAADASMLEEAMAHTVASNGLDDDFMFQWPILVEAALASGNIAVAERLLEPVAAAGSGILAPAVRAQFLRLRGLVGAARGDDPEAVEGDLRAGIAALAGFGAVGLRARAEEELARWLAAQGRRQEADELFASARATYEEIGATGWLTRLSAASLDVAPAET